MSIHLHRAERADVLVDALGEVLAVPAGDPFVAEVVCVPTRGVERWIAQRLSHRLGATSGGRVDPGDGVCTGVDFPSPRRLVDRALGEDGADDPWSPNASVWPLLAALDEVTNGSADHAWATALTAYLAEPSRRWSTARRLARLFARYAADRPTMLTAWAAGTLGSDVGPDGTPLPADRAWQPELWRRLRTRIDGPDPVERLRLGVGRLRARGADAAAIDLPARFSVFGPTRLDPRHLDVLVALAAHRELHLWLVHPSPVLWDAVGAMVEKVGERIPTPAGTASEPVLPLRADDPTVDAVHHPLLAYLGRDVRELQLRLLAAVAATGVPTTDTHHDARGLGSAATSAAPTTLLTRLQADLAADEPPTGDLVLRPDDSSVQVHACAGPHRQVEVLREVLVGLLADDETLEPRDIVVMCPDVETYAPLVAAAFGLAEDDDGGDGTVSSTHPGHRLRVRLADRSLRQLNPVLAVVTRVLDLADARLTRSAVLDLIAAPPVARRFRFSDDQLERLTELVETSGVRWGLDTADRGRFGMADFAQNTWTAGLDRLLLGVAMDESDATFFGTVLPLDDVSSDDVGLVGRLAELLSRLTGLVEACASPKSLPDWLALCREMVDDLTDVRPADRWQHAHAYGELARLAERAGPASTASTLTLGEVRTLLAEAFRGRASRANFRTGTLTVATLLPMRAVPHRVVCLLGLDDGTFPRRLVPDGDDLTAARPRVGDPDPRGEDRQLFLDAIGSARETLVVLYSGIDPRTGATLRPAVPVEALLDAVVGSVRAPADGSSVRDRIVCEHPLQPFAGANFLAASGAEPFSFDRAGLRAALTLRQLPRPAASPYAGLSLDPLPADRSVQLTELYRLLHHPVRALLRQRAQLGSGGLDEPDGLEQIPVELTGLERWSVGDRMLQSHLAGVGLEALAAAEWRRGAVPPRALGSRVVASLTEDVDKAAQAAAPWTERPGERVDLVVDLDAVRVSGSVAGVRDDVAVRVVFSTPSARQRLQAWVELLALSVTRPGVAWRSVVIGPRGRLELGPVDESYARAVLTDLVALHGAGLTGVLPFAPGASLAYARLRARGRDWDETYDVKNAWDRERDDLWADVLGPGAGLTALMALRLDAAVKRSIPGEDTHFGTVARRVYQPLLNAGGG